MKKKGFTLIELLAVIVVLGVIALIAVPLVLNTIDSSRRSAAKESASAYIKELEQEITIGTMYQNNKFLEGSYRVQADGSLLNGTDSRKLNIKGTLPSDGIICVDKNNNISTYSLKVNGYVINYLGDKQGVLDDGETLKISCDLTKEVVTIKPDTSSKICAKNKKIVINYPEIEGVKNQYRINNGEWLEYSEPITVTDDVVVFARIYNGTTESDTATLKVTGIDKEDVSDTSPNLALSSTNPTSSIISTFRQTDDCGLDETTIEYGISEDDKTYRWQKSNIFTGLKNNTLYYIKTRVNDIAESGVKESTKASITTGELITPVVTVEKQTEWTTSKKVSITGSAVGATLEYMLIYEDNTRTEWLEYKNEFTITKNNTSIVARLSDGTNIVSSQSTKVGHIDTTVPSITIGTISKTTKSLTIPFATTDSESGIKSTTCVYGESDSYGNNGVVSDNSCLINNIKLNTTYYYKIVTINNSNLTKEVTGNATTSSYGEIKIIENDSNWTANKVITITGSTEGASLQYKIGDITSSWTNYTSPFTIDSNTTIYARLYDGINEIDPLTHSVATIDNEVPTVSFIRNLGTLTLTLSDSQSGVNGYCVNSTNSSSGCSWTSIVATKSTIATYTVSSAGTYYIFAKDAVGRISSVSTATISLANLCSYETGQTWNYGYNGNVQSFNAPCKATYKLEVWGASGGYAYDSSRRTGGGGYGGYSVGNIDLSKNKTLYITVGGEGASNCQTTSCAGGYNGGSASSKWASLTGAGLYTAGGGGATHIAFRSGVLSSLSSYRSDVLIVAGGGGGGDYYPDWNTTSSGGSGGGYSGVNGTINSLPEGGSTTAGTQTSGYTFGSAGTLYTRDSTGGSGGGWYGGISNCIHSTGSGGSGYIGNSLLTSKRMYCYKCAGTTSESIYTVSTNNVSSGATSNYAKLGSGYARVTLISF